VPVDQAARILDKVKDGTWKAEDNDPADSMDPLGGLFDQFLGPDGLDGLRDLFGLGPNGSQTPDGPSGGSDMADRMLQQLLDTFLRELERELAPGTPAPQPAPDTAPGPDATPPNGADDPAADAIDRLMRQFLDELSRGLSPNAMPDPFAPDEGTDGQGA
jgi:hypothetical protein